MPKNHVLIVEDHEVLRNSLLSLFDRAGFYVDGTGNLTDAVKLLNRGAYDLVISDNRFPEFNDHRDEPKEKMGLEILKWMRNDEKYFSTPFILHTTDASPQVQELLDLHRGVLCLKESASLYELAEGLWLSQPKHQRRPCGRRFSYFLDSSLLRALNISAITNEKEETVSASSSKPPRKVKV